MCLLLLLSSFAIRKVFAVQHYNIGIATEQSFRYTELTDAKIWISKNASCRVLANRVTYIVCTQYTCMTALLEIVPWRNTYVWYQKLQATDYYVWEGVAKKEDRSYDYDYEF